MVRKSQKKTRTRVSRKHRRSSRSSRNRRNSRKSQRGGAYEGQWTGAYTFGQPVAAGSYAQEVVPQSGCVAEIRPGTISSLETSGLPGMRGGRYTVDVGAEPIAGMPAITRIGCEGGLVNTAPPAAPNPTPLQQGGMGGIDSAAYYAPTAGYTNQPSQWVSSTGAPSLLQIPYAAREYNPACLKTGGRRTRARRSKRAQRAKNK